MINGSNLEHYIAMGIGKAVVGLKNNKVICCDYLLLLVPLVSVSKFQALKDYKQMLKQF